MDGVTASWSLSWNWMAFVCEAARPYRLSLKASASSWGTWKGSTQEAKRAPPCVCWGGGYPSHSMGEVIVGGWGVSRELVFRIQPLCPHATPTNVKKGLFPRMGWWIISGLADLSPHHNTHPRWLPPTVWQGVAAFRCAPFAYWSPPCRLFLAPCV